jgi:hypothetical protein
MPLLNQNNQVPIYDVLRQSEWGERAFHVHWLDDPTGIVEISFLIDPQYSFKGFYRSTDHSHLQTSERPGDRHAVLEQVHNGQPLEALVTRIQSWLGNLKADLEATPKISRRYDELKSRLEELLANKQLPLDHIFSLEEQDELISKLNALKQEFDELAKKEKITKEQLNKAEAEIEDLKASLDYLTRGKWYRSFIYKTMVLGDAVWGSTEARGLLMKAGTTVISNQLTKLLGSGS